MKQLPATKIATKQQRVTTLPAAPILLIPLSAYHGHFARPVVKTGDHVLKYQPVALPDDPLSTPVHAPVSGRVIEVREFRKQDGKMVASILVLQNDFEETSAALPARLQSDPPPDMIPAWLAEAGVVGEGGAQFPAALKFRAAGRPVNAFIINGAECEPYLTADYALMREQTASLFEGIRLINTFLQAENIVIVVEDHNRDLEAVFAPYLAEERYAGYRLQWLTEGYPQGSERQVVKAVTGREIAPLAHPAGEGFVVSNVGTIVATHLALTQRLPVVSRIVTISGENIPRAGNFEVTIGTPIGHLLSQLDLSPREHLVVMGGAMMGSQAIDWASPVTKGCGGILLLPRSEFKRENCIGCGRCVDACPMGLMPMKYDEGWRRNNPDTMKRYQLPVCIECGMCEYVCPANVPLVASIKAGKALLRQKGSA